MKKVPLWECLSIMGLTISFMHSLSMNFRLKIQVKNKLQLKNLRKYQIGNVISEEEPFDFAYLKKLDDRCGMLSEVESEFMLSFWSESLQCMYIVYLLHHILIL